MHPRIWSHGNWEKLDFALIHQGILKMMKITKNNFC